MRKPRELRIGAYYQVTVRVNRGETIFRSAPIRRLFEEVLRRARAKYQFNLENLSLRGNFVQFIIQPETTPGLSRTMQWILSVFAMAFNRIKGLRGHVWGERFFSRVLGSIRELIQGFADLVNGMTESGERKTFAKDSFSFQAVGKGFLGPPSGNEIVGKGF